MADPDDEDWLLARERGEDVSHIPAATRARYEQLDRLIEALPEHAPPAGWKQRVLDALDAPAPRSSSDALAALPPTGPLAALDAPAPQRSPDALADARLQAPPAPDPGPAHTPAIGHRLMLRSRRTWGLAGGAVAAAIAALLLIARPETRSPVADPVVTAEVQRNGSAQRGDDAAVSDTLAIRGEADGSIELRVYGEGGEPLARCTDTQGCTVERRGRHRTYAVDLVLRSPGDVRVLLFTGEAIPEPRTDLDADLQAALAAHIEARQVAIVHVR